jgi:hypothetical protein
MLAGFALSEATPVPDAGKLDFVKVTARGFGTSASEAVSEAMKLAILQVNGASVRASTVSVSYGLDATNGQDSVSMRAGAFADAVRTHSGGSIRNFRILRLEEPTKVGGRFVATIEAEIAKFVPPQSSQNPKLVIAPVRVDATSVSIADTSVTGEELSDALHQKVVDALVNTGRFAVLDREFSPEVQQEIDLISSGSTPSEEIAKLGQANSADLVLSIRVVHFAYERHARALRTSDREIVSYSGAWAVNQKLVNVATRQLVFSGSLLGEAPTTTPSVLNPAVEPKRVFDKMTNDLAARVVGAILMRTFPVTVVSRDETAVILSQGGQTLKPGARYAVVAIGTEQQDRQTGKSLGLTEAPYCEVVVERVTPNLSYGHLEKIAGPRGTYIPVNLELREEITSASTLAQDVQLAPPTVKLPHSPKSNDDKW